MLWADVLQTLTSAVQGQCPVPLTPSVSTRLAATSVAASTDTHTMATNVKVWLHIQWLRM